MKKINGMLLVEIFGAIAWILCGLILSNFHALTFCYWGGFGFGIDSFLLAIVLNVLAKRPIGSNLTEANALFPIFTTAYLVISVITDAIFMYFIRNDEIHLGKFLVIANIIFIFVYVGAVIFSGQYAERLRQQSDMMTDRIVGKKEISKKLQSIMNIAEDEDVKKSLYSLKEKVAYSTNTSPNFTREAEEQIFAKLIEIQNAINNEHPKEGVLNAVKEVEKMWNQRNSMATFAN